MKFIRLNIIVEGQTEERFVKDTLANHLGHLNISTDVRRVLTSKDKYIAYRGGLLSYAKAKKDIETWLKEDQHPEARFTTMFDLYALPKDFPGYAEAQRINDPYEKVAFLEQAMNDEIGDRRFFAYIQLHEFEALVLANARNLEYEYLEHEQAITALEEMVEENGGNPELINEGRNTAPSKRIIAKIPEYEGNKANVAPDVAALTGMEALREACPHFDEWIRSCEALSTE